MSIRDYLSRTVVPFAVLFVWFILIPLVGWFSSETPMDEVMTFLLMLAAGAMAVALSFVTGSRALATALPTAALAWWFFTRTGSAIDEMSLVFLGLVFICSFGFSLAGARLGGEFRNDRKARKPPQGEQSGAGRVFERESVWQRGYLSNWSPANPVQRLAFDQTGLGITSRRTTEKVPYALLAAEIRRTYRWEGMRMSGRWWKQTLVTLKSPDHTYTLDLSESYPDFKDSKDILELIRSRIATQERQETIADIQRMPTFLFLAACILVGVAAPIIGHRITLAEIVIFVFVTAIGVVSVIRNSRSEKWEQAPNPYETLGVSAKASAEDIHNGYIRSLHEIRASLSPAHPNHERLAAVENAYRVLSDPTKRAQFDHWRDFEDPTLSASDLLAAQLDRTVEDTSFQPIVGAMFLIVGVVAILFGAGIVLICLLTIREGVGKTLLGLSLGVLICCAGLFAAAIGRKRLTPSTRARGQTK